MKQKNSKIQNKDGYKRMVLKAVASPVIYMCMLCILGIIISILAPISTFSIFSLLLVMLCYTIFLISFEIKGKNGRLKEIEYEMKNIVGKNTQSLNLPIIYISNEGSILWQNSFAEALKLKEHIDTLLVEINKPNKKEDIKINIEDKTFLLHTTDLTVGEMTGKMVVFVDITEKCTLEKLLDSTKTTIGIITIDSFDEVMQGLDEMDKAETISKIDTFVISWIKQYDGIVSKIEKDRYVYIIEKKYVAQMEEASFDILEKVSKISEDKVKVPITLSIGMSYDEDTLSNRYKMAMTSLDIAMGRGGNQAVIKNKKKYDIYGDQGKQEEKTSRVRARMVSQALKDIIEKSDNVYIMGHKNSDADCIGASVGVYKIAKTYGKQAKIIVDVKHNNSAKIIMDRLKTSEEYADVFVTKDDLKKQSFENSLLVVVDTHKASYLAYPDLYEEFEKVVVIDHHRRGPEFIENSILTYHEVYASSASELVTELLMYLDDVKITEKEAEAIFSGIIVDTKNFSFKTGVRTFEVAAYLKKSGLDITEVKHLFQNDFDSYMAKVDIVKDAEIIDGKIALSVCSASHKDMGIIAAQAADELLSITGVLASFVLCKIDDIINISGRSLGDINVQVILEKLGGGGHLTFAGAQLSNVTLEEAKEKLLSVIDEYFGKE